MPPVIAAPDALLLDAPELQRGAAMGAVLVQQPDVSLKIAKDDKVFAKNADSDRLFTELTGHGDGLPEASEILAARGGGADLQQF